MLELSKAKKKGQCSKKIAQKTGGLMKIYITNLKINTIIGILKHERKNKQNIIIDCKIKYKCGFIDYKEIKDIIVTTIKKQKFKLLEDAIEFLIKKITKRYRNVKKIKLKIRKLDIFDDCIVGVSN